MSNYIRSTLKNITPLEMYKTLVKSSTEGARYSGSDLEVIPSQFGGLRGQAAILKEGLALQQVDFKIEGTE